MAVQGLVLPPKVAPQQLVVIPIPNSKMAEDTRKVSIHVHVGAICTVTTMYSME